MKNKKCMVVIASLIMISMSGYSALTLNWSSTSPNLATPIPTIQVGWLVQMYQDVSANTALGSITSFDSMGVETGGNTGDDQLLGSFTTTITSSKGVFQFGANNLNATAIAGASVYTVIFNNAAVGGASQAWVMDATPTVLASSGSASYSLPLVNFGPIAVVPEPSSIALIGIGLAVIALRRRFVK